VFEREQNIKVIFDKINNLSTKKLSNSVKSFRPDWSFVKSIPGDACKQAGLDHHLKGKDDWMFAIGKRIVFKAIKEAIGLDR
jgi:hypothetical protein